MAFAYIAGPLFDEGERWFVERLDAIARDAGFETFLPHRDNPPKTSDNVDVIYRDWRARFPNDNEHVNLMIERSLEHFVRTEDELRQVLAQIHTDTAT